uniref:Uncharacterized protein n=1 Tax=Romanomermis culicivorax TaxID=13658 RepID=A0A915JJM9_ROMCU
MTVNNNNNNKAEFKRLKELAKTAPSTSNACLKLTNHQRTVSLPWGFMLNFRKGVRTIVEKGLNKYNPAMKAVPLGFGKIKAIKRLVRIIEDHPCLHLDIDVEYVVFKPTIGEIIQCVVTRVDEGQVVCCAHNVISANMWLNEGIKVKSFPQLGDQVNFKIKAIHAHNGLVQLTGKIVH